MRYQIATIRWSTPKTKELKIDLSKQMINNRKLKSFPKFTSKSSYVFEHMRSAYAHKNKLSCRIIMTCTQRMNCDSLYGFKLLLFSITSQVALKRNNAKTLGVHAQSGFHLITCHRSVHVIIHDAVISEHRNGI